MRPCTEVMRTAHIAAAHVTCTETYLYLGGEPFKMRDTPKRQKTSEWSKPLGSKEVCCSHVLLPALPGGLLATPAPKANISCRLITCHAQPPKDGDLLLAKCFEHICQNTCAQKYKQYRRAGD